MRKRVVGSDQTSLQNYQKLSDRFNCCERFRSGEDIDKTCILNKIKHFFLALSFALSLSRSLALSLSRSLSLSFVYYSAEH